jgi:hypothetical protein
MCNSSLLDVLFLSLEVSLFLQAIKSVHFVAMVLENACAVVSS